MASRFVRPDTAILKISNGDTLTVKRRLNAGEQRARKNMKLFPSLVDVADVLAYLIDWSLADDAGTKVEIAKLSRPDLTDMLDAIDPDSFTEIHTAVLEHEKRMTAEREQEKNGQDGANTSSAISPSPEPAAGASSGSAS